MDRLPPSPYRGLFRHKCPISGAKPLRGDKQAKHPQHASSTPWARHNGRVHEAHELIALALALDDEGRPDHEVVAALVAAAEGHMLRLQSAYASTLYLSHEMPLDQRAERLARTFLKALEHVAAHEPTNPEAAADIDWLGRGGQREATRDLAERLAVATGDRETVLRNARQLQADLERLRREP